jgi:hypothetical protein
MGFFNAIGVSIHECLTHENAQQETDQCDKDHCNVKISITIKFQNLMSFCPHCFWLIMFSPSFVFTYCVKITCRDWKLSTSSFLLDLVYLQSLRSSVFAYRIFSFFYFCLHVKITYKALKIHVNLHSSFSWLDGTPKAIS